jgi:hypothetical protein
MRTLALLLTLATLAACDEPMVMETDISGANRATACPVDVSEADRADYPGCL